MSRHVLVLSFALALALTAPAAAQRGVVLYDLPHEGLVSGIVDAVQEQDFCKMSKDGSCRECDCCKGTELCQGVHLVLKTGQRKLDVYLGPWWFVERNEITIAQGAQVVILGARVRLPMGNVLLAREVTVGLTTFKLRDAMGRPLWLDRFTE
jgi:hypothetical protein